MVDLLIRVAVVVAIGVLGYLLKQIPYFKPAPGRFTEDDLPALRQEFARWEAFAAVPIILAVAPAVWLWYLGFIALSDYYYSVGKQPVYLLTLPRLVWWIPAFFLGLLSAIPMLTLLYRAMLKDRYADYLDYCDLNHGVNGWRFLKLTVWFILIAGILFLPQMLKTHAAFHEKWFELRGFLSLSDQQFKYEDIATLIRADESRAPNGKWVHRPHYAIQFDDGTAWNTKTFDPIDRVNLADLFEFLANKTKLPVQHVQRIE